MISPRRTYSFNYSPGSERAPATARAEVLGTEDAAVTGDRGPAPSQPPSRGVTDRSGGAALPPHRHAPLSRQLPPAPLCRLSRNTRRLKAHFGDFGFKCLTRLIATLAVTSGGMQTPRSEGWGGWGQCPAHSRPPVSICSAVVQTHVPYPAASSSMEIVSTPAKVCLPPASRSRLQVKHIGEEESLPFTQRSVFHGECRISSESHPNHSAKVRKEIGSLTLQIQRKPSITCNRGAKNTNRILGPISEASGFSTQSSAAAARAEQGRPRVARPGTAPSLPPKPLRSWE